MTQPQKRFDFSNLDAELGLAKALRERTGRDLFEGRTTPADRQAAARIAIIMNRLEAEFGAAYQRIYGEPLPERRPVTTTNDKGK